MESKGRKGISVYYAKKTAVFLASVAVLSALVFWMSRLAPGDPLVAYYGDRTEKMTVEERESARERLGLNDPIYVQYFRWVENALNGDMGISYKYKQDVLEVVGSRAVNTLLLGGLGFAVIFAGSLLLGILCARFEGKGIDRILRKAGTVISCIPEFWLALLLILIFSVFLKILPSGGAYSLEGGGVADRILHLILPLTVVVMGHLWYYAYMVRNKMAAELASDYAITAKAKGLPMRRVIFCHCLPNIMPSYISIMTVSVAHIAGGTYIAEMVFSYPGMGTLAYESARYSDYNMLMTVCLITGIAVILMSMAGQIISERIDPRLRNTVQTAAPSAAAPIYEEADL